MMPVAANPVVAALARTVSGAAAETMRKNTEAAPRRPLASSPWWGANDDIRAPPMDECVGWPRRTTGQGPDGSSVGPSADLAESRPPRLRPRRWCQGIADPVDEQGHLIAHLTYVTATRREHRERGAVRDGHQEQEPIVHLHHCFMTAPASKHRAAPWVRLTRPETIAASWSPRSRGRSREDAIWQQTIDRDCGRMDDSWHAFDEVGRGASPDPVSASMPSSSPWSDHSHGPDGLNCIRRESPPSRAGRPALRIDTDRYLADATGHMPAVKAVGMGDPRDPASRSGGVGGAIVQQPTTVAGGSASQSQPHWAPGLILLAGRADLKCLMRKEGPSAPAINFASTTPTTSATSVFAWPASFAWSARACTPQSGDGRPPGTGTSVNSGLVKSGKAQIA